MRWNGKNIYIYIYISPLVIALPLYRLRGVFVCVCAVVVKLTIVAQKSRFSHPWKWELLDSQMFSASDTQTP